MLVFIIFTQTLGKMNGTFPLECHHNEGEALLKGGLWACNQYLT